MFSMSRFSRQWTIDLNISNQNFFDSFHHVVRKGGDVILENPFFLANNEYNDFFGAIQQSSFRMWKRPGSLDFKGVPELYGKIIDNGNSIQLELKLINNFRFNYISIVFSDVFIGFSVFFIFNAITRMGAAMTGASEVAFIVIGGLAMSGVVHYFQLKRIDRYLDNLEDLYNNTLLTIESTAKTEQ